MIKKILGLLILCLGVGFTFAFDIPAYDGYVTDQANILTEAQKQDLDSQISGFVHETSSQLGVLIIPSLEGEDIAMLATDVGNKRGVGERDYNNGLVMVIAINDRKRFIAVGYGLEGTIPDAIANLIGETDFPDDFRAGDYYAGIQSAVNDLYGYIKNDPTVVHEYQASSSWDISKIDPGFLIVLLFVFGGLLGRFITSPDPKDKKKRKMTKASWTKFALIGGVISAILFGFMGTVIRALILAYGGLGLVVALALIGLGGGRGGMFFGGGGIGSSGGGSSFGGFGGGSFGGGGGGGGR